MNQILCVPSASKNLISVKRFCSNFDHLMTMKFDPQRLLIKTINTKDILMIRKESRGLYQLPIPIEDSGIQVNQMKLGMKATAC